MTHWKQTADTIFQGTKFKGGHLNNCFKLLGTLFSAWQSKAFIIIARLLIANFELYTVDDFKRSFDQSRSWMLC